MRPGENNKKEKTRDGTSDAPARRSGRRATPQMGGVGRGACGPAARRAYTSGSRHAGTAPADAEHVPPPSRQGPRLYRTTPSCHTVHTAATEVATAVPRTQHSRSEGGGAFAHPWSHRGLTQQTTRRVARGENSGVSQKRPPRRPARASGLQRGGVHGGEIRPGPDASGGSDSTADGRAVADPSGKALYDRPPPPVRRVCLLQTLVDGGETVAL